MVRFAVLLLLTAARALQLPTAPPRRGVVVAAAPGEPLYLCEEHVAIALDECKREYDAVFYQDESLKMSGDVRCAGIDGCDVTLRLVGMFWHSRRVVFDLAANYL